MKRTTEAVAAAFQRSVKEGSISSSSAAAQAKAPTASAPKAAVNPSEPPAKRARRRASLLPDPSRDDGIISFDNGDLNLDVDEATVDTVASLMLGRISGASGLTTDEAIALPIVGLEPQKAELEAFLTNVTTAAENNSLLLVGPQGSGRHSALRAALKSVAQQFYAARAALEDDASASADIPYRLVWLQGSSLNDDSAALREISRQLAVDVRSAGGVGASGSSALGAASGDEQAAGGDDNDDSATAGVHASPSHVAWAPIPAAPAPAAAAASVVTSAANMMTSPLRALRDKAKHLWPSLTTYAHSAAGGDSETAARAIAVGAAAAESLMPGAARRAQEAAAAAEALRLTAAGDDADDDDNVGGAVADENGDWDALSGSLATGTGGGSSSRRGSLAIGAGSSVLGASTSPGAAAGGASVAVRSRGRGWRGRGRGGTPDRRHTNSSSSGGGASSPAAGAGAITPFSASRRGGGGASAALVSTPGGSTALGGSSFALSQTRHGLNKNAFESHLQFVVSSLKEGRHGGVPVFIIVDEFDQFARKTKQTLLYNLLDLTQDAKVHLAIIGLTTRLDVLQLLEKRLKSRFSHRQLLFTHPGRADLRSLCEAALALPLPLAQALPPAYVAAWASGASACVVHPRTVSLCDVIYRSGNRLGARNLLDWLGLLLAQICGETPIPSPDLLPDEALTASVIRAAPSHALRQGALTSLSLTEVILLSAMAHIELRHRGSAGSGYGEGGPQYNFSMVYHEVASRFKGTSASTVRQAAQQQQQQQQQANNSDGAGAGGGGGSRAPSPSPPSSSSSLSASDALSGNVLSMYHVEAPVALRCFEALLTADLVRFVPRSSAAADGKAGSSGAGGGPSSSSAASSHYFTDLTRDRCDLAHQPCLLLLEPDALLAAVKAGTLPQLPSDVRHWVLKGAQFAPT